MRRDLNRKGITMPHTRVVPPSAEVREEARRRAIRIAEGLYPHQVEGVAFLLGRRRAILADDMGLGKTRQAIVALTEAEPEGPWLVVCPASVKRNWAREIEQARPGSAIHIVGPDAPPVPRNAATNRNAAVSPATGPDAEGETSPGIRTGSGCWVVVNYDILKTHLDALLAHDWAGIVFDEAHYVKNHTSQRSRLGRRLVEREGKDPAIVALTGTPLANRPRDLFALLQLVRHPMAKSFLSFAKRYCAAHHNGYGWVTDGASNLDDLRAQLHGVMLRRTKDQVLDLPPKIRTWLEVDVREGIGRRETRDVLRALLGRQPRANLLVALTRARLRIAAAKTERTIEFVEGAVAQGEKVIVFTGFDEPARRIHTHFGGAAVLLTGATPAHRRQGLVDRFQGDDSVRVFVANLIAGGVGLNLTAARQVVFNDLDWTPANHWQAEDRAYRIGQTGTVNVSYLVARNTVDEFVARVLAVKTGLIDAVVEGSASPDTDVLRELESLVESISPRLEDGTLDDDAVERMLRDAVRAYETRHAEALVARDNAPRADALPSDAIDALIRALASPTTTRYRVTSGSRPGVAYTIEVDGPDVTCSCPGFEYRGNCSHARQLKSALAKGGQPPAGFESVAVPRL
jgi:SWI/SNF-related matrix-associated actin-dependent regulator 1 of chromatin subfamily A